MHSVRFEPTKLILIGTRTTYQTTGDAGLRLTGYFHADEASMRQRARLTHAQKMSSCTRSMSLPDRLEI